MTKYLTKLPQRKLFSPAPTETSSQMIVGELRHVHIFDGWVHGSKGSSSRHYFLSFDFHVIFSWAMAGWSGKQTQFFAVQLFSRDSTLSRAALDNPERVSDLRPRYPGGLIERAVDPEALSGATTRYEA
jgi:hypothetical protein